MVNITTQGQLYNRGGGGGVDGGWGGGGSWVPVQILEERLGTRAKMWHKKIEKKLKEGSKRLKN